MATIQASKEANFTTLDFAMKQRTQSQPILKAISWLSLLRVAKLQFRKTNLEEVPRTLTELSTRVLGLINSNTKLYLEPEFTP